MRNFSNRFLTISLTAALGLAMGSCTQPVSNQAVGTGIGAGVGAGVGAIAGNNIRGISKGEGAVAGALIGGLIGNVQGRQQDQINQIRAEQAAQNLAVIDVVNSNGSITPVQLQHVGNGRWQGPRGEVYPNLPTSNQLYNAYGF